MSTLNQIVNWLSGDFHYRASYRVFRKLLYTILLFQMLVLCLPVAEMLWGADSIIDTVRNKNTWSYNFYMALHNAKWAGYYPYLIVFHIAALLVGFLGKYQRLVSIVVYVTTVLLFNRIYLFITGGNYLIHILLFYMMFIVTNGKNEVSHILSNCFFWACRIQVILVYFFATTYKLTGNIWQEGSALKYLFSMQEFSIPFLTDVAPNMGILLTIATYFSLAYQLMFPIMVWLKKVKRQFLIIGVLFHLGIIFIMGIPVFGLVMIATYALFLSEKEVAKVPLVKRL